VWAVAPPGSQRITNRHRISQPMRCLVRIPPYSAISNQNEHCRPPHLPIFLRAVALSRALLDSPALLPDSEALVAASASAENETPVFEVHLLHAKETVRVMAYLHKIHCADSGLCRAAREEELRSGRLSKRCRHNSSTDREINLSVFVAQATGAACQRAGHQ